MSAPYLLNNSKVFLLILVKCSSQWDGVRIYDKTTLTTGSGHIGRSLDWALYFVSHPYLCYPERIYFKFLSIFFLIEAMCRTQNSAMQTAGHGHNWILRDERCFHVRSMSPLFQKGFSLKFNQMFSSHWRFAEFIIPRCLLHKRRGRLPVNDILLYNTLQ